MRTILHILTRPDDSVAADVIARQQAAGEAKVEVLSVPPSGANYGELVKKVFEADSVQVW